MQPTQELIVISDPGEVGKEKHNRVDRAVIFVSNLVAWVFPVLMIVICTQVVLRSSGGNQAWLDDLQWWLYGGSALIAIAYAVTTNSHVRVDIFHEHYSERRKNRIEVFALVWLFLPFVILAWDVTLPYAAQSLRNDEGSSSPNGLHNLWLLKIFMNIAFLFIGVAVWAAYVRFLSRLAEPSLWRQMLYAFPSTMFLINLVVYYAIWWTLRLTSPAEVTNRDIDRHPVFGTFEIGVEEIKYTIAITFVGTILAILAAYLLRRRHPVGEES
ncbi:MAG: TRAP transporter small permease subunit [Pseudomonadota bacterium]